MSWWELLLVALAGGGAGLINAVVGTGTAFPPCRPWTAETISLKSCGAVEAFSAASMVMRPLVGS